MLGFDFGEKRIGVAVGDLGLRTAHPVATVREADAERRFAAIARLIDEWRPALLAVGVPGGDYGTAHRAEGPNVGAPRAETSGTGVSSTAISKTGDPSSAGTSGAGTPAEQEAADGIDGLDHPFAPRCRRFARQLHGRFQLPVALCDESFSSCEAESLLDEAGVHGRKQRRHLDALAAAAILRTLYTSLDSP